MKRVVALVLCLLLVVFSPYQPVLADTLRWNGAGGDGSWHNAANWELGIVPADGDYVVIPKDSVVNYIYGETSVQLNIFGRLRVSGGTLKFVDTSLLQEIGTLEADADITVASGSFVWDGNLEGSGDLVLESGTLLYAKRGGALDLYLVNKGIVSINESLTLRGGAEGNGNFSMKIGDKLALAGNGTYNLSPSTINIAGTLKIANTCESVKFDTSSFRLQSAGSLEFDIGGTNDFTKLEVTGIAHLDNQLKINILDGYGPQIGDTFEIMTYGSRAGQFTSIVSNVPEIAFKPAYNDTSLVLTVVTVPSAPQNFTATPGDGQVSLSWQSPESDGGEAITKYQVSKDNGTTWEDVGLTASYTFTGLSNGTAYDFQVRACNYAGAGPAASATASPIGPDFAGGDGSEHDPFLIETVAQLANVRKYLGTGHSDKHFKLVADLNLDVAPYNNGRGWDPIGTDEQPFAGSFDGDGHTISNLFIYNYPDSMGTGLFGRAGETASIKNVGLLNVDVSGEYYVGGLVGYNLGEISNAYATGSVTGLSGVGGLVGQNHGTITGSWAAGTVDQMVAGYSFGGLAGANSGNGTIADCYADVDVTAKGSSEVGGLVGLNLGLITGSYALGDVESAGSAGGLAGGSWGETAIIEWCYAGGIVKGNNAGGLVGYNLGSVSCSYAEGDVSGTSYGGGLAGLHGAGLISNCYARGDVSGAEYSGGLVGFSTGSISKCYSTGFVDGNPYAGGLVGRTGDGPEISDCYWDEETSGQLVSEGGTGKSTGDMKKQETYDDWDFLTIWSIDDTGERNDGYPFLAWCTVPAAPQNVMAAAGDGQVTLSWDAPISDGGAPITKYQVSKDGGESWVDVMSGTTYTFTGLTTGTTYTFKVRAVNSVGPGAAVTATATPEAPAPTTYTVNFYSNNSLYASKTVTAGSALGVNWPAEPARSGYTFGGWFTGPNGTGTQYTAATVITADVDLHAKWTPSGGTGGGGGGGGTRETGGGRVYTAQVIPETGADKMYPVLVVTGTGTTSLAEEPWAAKQQETTVVLMPSIPGVDTYAVSIPMSDLSTPEAMGVLSVKTEMASVTVSSNMLAGVPGISGDTAVIAVSTGDKSKLPGTVRAAIGDKPLVQLTLTVDGKQVDWNNPKAPVTVSIPYTPTAEELANSESIVIWYIDGSGNVVCIPNGLYDPETGMVTFRTTHFSRYAVAYNKVTFKDVPANAWYYKAVSFCAAREITLGTGGGNFSPNGKLTRAEFLVLLMRAYGIAPDVNPADNFADAGNAYYTGYLAAAKRLGIAEGVGNNLFAPGSQITRQEMFTLLCRTLEIIGQLPQGSSGKTLTDFADARDVAPWAKEAVSHLVRTGMVTGADGKLLPAGTATRAEIAQVLYNLLGK